MNSYNNPITNSITLDLDGYQLGFIKNNYKVYIEHLEYINTHVQISEIIVYNSNKGLNVVINHLQKVSYKDNMFIRLLLFDDLFRLRADILKYCKQQLHRFNRIWLVKDGFKKEIIYSELDLNLVGLGEFEKQFIKIIENKQKELYKLKGGKQ